MFMYEKLKKNWPEIQPKLVWIATSLVMFGAGFGAGNYDRKNSYKRFQVKPQVNYTTQKPQGEVKAVSTPAPVKEAVTGKTDQPAADCKIKGNIGTSGKIYHIPGGRSYKIVKPEQCFNTEEEAVSAGFRKALQ